MLSQALLLALGAAVTSVEAVAQGFNYGSTFTDGRLKVQSDFEDEFRAAKQLTGTDEKFTSARLYTMVQGGTSNEPISAIPAAISTDTSLLLGLWASAGAASFSNELDALRKAIEQYSGQGLRLDGISVGSEDLYRNSPTGIANKEYAGAEPAALVSYIAQVRDALSGTEWEGTPVGHVDTWTAWVNGSNAAVVDAVDWLGMDAYAYFEDTKPNAISNGKTRFQEALQATQGAAKGKAVWVTETGWPVSGKQVGAAVPSPENARAFWQDVGCDTLFGKVNTWWYTFQDSAPTTPNPSFGVVGATLGEDPLFDLSCDASSGGDETPDDGTVGGGDASTTATATTATATTAVTTPGETSPGAPFPTGNATTPWLTASSSLVPAATTTSTSTTTEPPSVPGAAAGLSAVGAAVAALALAMAAL